MANAKPYPLMIDTRVDSSAEAMIKDLNTATIDAGVLWGPMAGFYAKQANPPLHVTPLVKETTGPATGLSHRHGRAARRPELEAAAQPADPGEPAARSTRSCSTSACRCSTRTIGRSPRRRRPSRHDADALAALVAAMRLRALLRRSAAGARAEPEGYRTENYRAPVPATLAGARVLTTARGRGDLARQERRLHRRAAAPAEAAESAGRHGLARQAAVQHSRQHLAAGYRLRRAGGRDGRLFAAGLARASRRRQAQRCS